MTFDDLNLNNSLLAALSDRGYTTPTTIQQKVFSVAMSGRDVCGIAQTGTGKTFAYLLPCLRQWKFTKSRYPEILIIVPTRELVAQVVESVKELTTHMAVEVLGVFGGMNINPQRLAVQNKVDVLVATPGRLYDLAMSGSLRVKDIKKLIIDEVDEMLNLGFRTQLKNILELLPSKRQNLLFSATMTEEVELLMTTYFNDPVRIEAAPAGTPLEKIDQLAYEVPNFNTKVNLLEWLLSNDPSMSKVLIFVATKQLANQLYARIAESFTESGGVIHSDKEQNHRFNTVNRFKDGTYRFIIATDIIARGLDVAEVSHVINFDLPEVPENYIHRIGRTGRAEQKGIAISFITPTEKEQQQEIESLMNFSITMKPLPAEVELSTVLTEEEKPVIYMKIPETKIPKRVADSGAFHEKSEKNKKTNKVVRNRDRMMQKYGKPIRRGNKDK